MTDVKRVVRKTAWELLRDKITKEGMQGKFTLGELVDVIRLCEGDGNVNLRLSDEQLEKVKNHMESIG